MGFKSYAVHYANKYPGAQIRYDEKSLEVCKDGQSILRLEKDGHGSIVCASDSHGCDAAHDLSPIPKEARFQKLFKDGRVGKAEEHDERRPVAEALAQEFGKVPSIAELQKMGRADAMGKLIAKKAE